MEEKHTSTSCLPFRPGDVLVWQLSQFDQVRRSAFILSVVGNHVKVLWIMSDEDHYIDARDIAACVVWQSWDFNLVIRDGHVSRVPWSMTHGR